MPLEVTIFGKTGLKLGKKRCLVVFLADASGFDCSLETARAQLQN